MRSQWLARAQASARLRKRGQPPPVSCCVAHQCAGARLGLHQRAAAGRSRRLATCSARRRRRAPARSAGQERWLGARGGSVASREARGRRRRAAAAGAHLTRRVASPPLRAPRSPRPRSAARAPPARRRAPPRVLRAAQSRDAEHGRQPRERAPRRVSPAPHRRPHRLALTVRGGFGGPTRDRGGVGGPTAMAMRRRRALVRHVRRVSSRAPRTAHRDCGRRGRRISSGGTGALDARNTAAVSNGECSTRPSAAACACEGNASSSVSAAARSISAPAAPRPPSARRNRAPRRAAASWSAPRGVSSASRPGRRRTRRRTARRAPTQIKVADERSRARAKRMGGPNARAARRSDTRAIARADARRDLVTRARESSRGPVARDARRPASITSRS